MRGPNVPDPRDPDTIRKSHSTVALTRQAIHDGSVPRLATRSTGKAAQLHDTAAPVADIKVDAPGGTSPKFISPSAPLPVHNGVTCLQGASLDRAVEKCSMYTHNWCSGC